MNKELTRKEISAMTGNKVSERTICNREKEWGLDKCRQPFARRPVLYVQDKAVARLRIVGLIS